MKPKNKKPKKVRANVMIQPGHKVAISAAYGSVSAGIEKLGAAIENNNIDSLLKN